MRAWTGSHHDLAMMEMDDPAIDTAFEGNKHDKGTLSHRINPTLGTVPDNDPEVTPAPIASAPMYTFGVSPLMQFLVGGRDGRMQVHNQVYDTRPESEGGQRWFDLYPDDDLQPGDPFHWTGHQQTWNHQCAECHSTGLQRKYDFETDTYATCWQEIDVACEACHGPASNHVDWARGVYSGQDLPQLGLLNPLTDPVKGVWQTSQATGLPVRTPPREADQEVQTCATCHSRRTPLTDGHTPGAPFLDDYRPALLTDGLYEADGQIDAEVYVWGSFTQSRMHQQGVTCKDCHDPHSLRLRIPGDGTCIQCHEAHVYQTPLHHHHDRAGEGARCVSCHMTSKTYMGIDGRRDHSFRVPRPDLAVELGTPDACSACHEQGPAWAAEKSAAWWGELGGDSTIARALHAVREDHASAPKLLLALLQDTERSTIARATAAEALGNIGGPGVQIALEIACLDEDPLLRATAARALAFAPPTPPRIQLLKDPDRGVRIAAAASLVTSIPPGMEHKDEHVRRAFDEYVESLGANFEHSWARVEMAKFQAARGMLEEARATLDVTITRDPTDVSAWALAADLLRIEKRERQCIQLLGRALDAVPDSPELRLALGLAFVRVQDYVSAETELRTAAASRPGDPYFGFVHAVALDGLERRAEATTVLETVRALHPADRDVLTTLIQWHHEAERPALVQELAGTLRARFPNDEGIRELLQGLGQDD